MSKININDEEFSKRMKFILENRFNDNYSEFARAVGVAQPSLVRWVKGEADPSRNNLIKIAEVGGVKIDWLATGSQIEPNSLEKLDNYQNVNTLDDSDYECIKDFRGLRVSAGFGVENGDYHSACVAKVEKAWLQTRRLKAKDCAMFRVNGDSMEPTLKDEEEIIVDCSKDELQEGKIFVINHGGTMWVKKVRINFNSLDLISDNPEYPPITLTAEEANELNIIGQVVRGYRNF